jgi:uncharacterized repeat protein (TIGR03809 family)
MGLMADSIPRCMSAALIHKLHALAERRCAHLLDLHQSGRWTRFYSREAFVAQMNDAAMAAKQWQQLADEVAAPPPEPAATVEIIPVEKLSGLSAAIAATAVGQWRATISAGASDIVTAA